MFVQLKKNHMSVETHVSQYVAVVEALKKEVLLLKERGERERTQHQQQVQEYEQTILDLKQQLQVRQRPPRAVLCGALTIVAWPIAFT